MNNRWNELWDESTNLPTDVGVYVYTTGDCWMLAYALHRVAGFSLIFTGSLSDLAKPWDHVLVEVEHDQYLDIEGLHTEEELRRRYFGYRGPLARMDNPPKTFAKYCDLLPRLCGYSHAMSPTYGYTITDATKIAKKVISSYLTPARCRSRL